MASARCLANIGVQPLFAVPLHMKAVIDDINIDNQGTSGKITVQLEDDFTQDISATLAAPAGRSAFPFQTTVAQNASVSADKNTVDQIRCLGNVGAICSATDAGCVIEVFYHFE
jgi:Na+-transporting methylmalonyl-CoA/oxaloacetate decarboxylase beta subunit